MRTVVATMLLLACLAGCRRTLDPDSAAAFEHAQQSFDAAQNPTDFLLAASRFQQLLDRGVKSGAIFYNQGNAYMRGGKRGQAIACYRQAKRYRPRDPQLDANLQFALGSLPRSDSKPLIEYVLFWQNWLSYSGKFQLSISAAALTLLLALVGLFLDSTIWRRAAAGLLVITFLSCCSALYDWYRYEYTKHGVVTSPTVIARKGNSETYEPAFTSQLAEGTEFTITDQRGDWLLMKLPAGQEGWVKRSDVVTY